MTDNTHNLDENISEFFEFVLGGHKYKMRYPTSEEAEKVSELKDDKASEWVMSFIEPLGKESPPIKEALKKANVKVVARFNKMIITEFTEA